MRKIEKHLHGASEIPDGGGEASPGHVGFEEAFGRLSWLLQSAEAALPSLGIYSGGTF